ncbi:hypothetical protein [Alteromonas sp. H39]|uniref:hypothetical protein n=1 Tax=Alteromonas sp. H39 TaxID=3389876 RepID=UPI0039E1D68E
MKFLSVAVFFMLLITQTSNANEQPVATVLDQTISPSDLIREDGQQIPLTRLIIPTLLQHYKADNNLSFEPTPEERQRFIVWFNKQNADHEEDTRKRKQDTLAQIKALAKENGLSKEETEKQINAFLDMSANQPPMDERMADFVLPHWKSQVYFYKNYGGGRILWQQRGTEAFDAFHNWLKSQEEKGNFKIFAQKDRDAFYDYWNRESSFLTSDEEAINEGFLQPPWSR